MVWIHSKDAECVSTSNMRATVLPYCIMPNHVFCINQYQTCLEAHLALYRSSTLEIFCKHG